MNFVLYRTLSSTEGHHEVCAVAHPFRGEVFRRRIFGFWRIRKRGLKRELDAGLGGEGDADGGAGAKEVSQRPGRDKQLLATRNRHRAACVRAKRSDVREIVHRYWQSADIADIVIARIVAIEEVEEFHEGRERPALVELDGAADAQLGLQVWRAWELIERGLHSVDHDAIANRSG